VRRVGTNLKKEKNNKKFQLRTMKEDHLSNIDEDGLVARLFYDAFSV
jgi:hypothetical protein